VLHGPCNVVLTWPYRIFGSAEEFEEAQRKRRSGLVQAFLADLPLDTRAAVVAAVQQDLADLGIVAA
jgi:hypothetical protein